MTVRSIVVKDIENAEWRRFKNIVSLRGQAIGTLVRSFIIEYCQKADTERLPSRKPKAKRVYRRPHGSPPIDKYLVRYASKYNIQPGADDFLEKVLDAVEADYDRHHKERGWIRENREMLFWFNSKKGEAE